MNDASNIFQLYMESVEQEEPHMVTLASGTKEWKLNGKRHRLNGPAVVNINGQSWWKFGQLHREDGPAVSGDIYTDMWYLNGTNYADAEAWAEALLKQRNQPHGASDVNAFLRTILK